MGILFELHSCGKNDKLVPVFVEAGVDIWMPQNKVNDFALLYRLCAKDILLGIPTETTPDMPDEDAFEAAKAYVRRFGKDGHVIVSDDLHPAAPENSRVALCAQPRLSKSGLNLHRQRQV
jgi:hypothetical protein